MRQLLLWGALLFGWLGLGVRAVRAEQAKLVLVLAPERADEALTEVTARVRGELAAAGFRVLTREPPSGVSPLHAVEHTGLELAPSAVLWIVTAAAHSAEHPKLEIWLSDRLLGNVSMARLGAAPGRPSDANALAVQAVELLRARLSELRVGPEEPPADESWVEQPSEAPPPPPPPVAPDRAASEPRRVYGGLSAGLGVVFDSGNLEPALLPLVSCAISVAEPRPGDLPLAVDLRLTGAGFGSSQEFSIEQGSARVAQAFGEGSVALRWVPRAPIEPWLSAGVGVYTVGVEGSAEAPYQSRTDRAWAALGSVGLGVRTRPWAHLSLGVAGELMGVPSRTAVRVTEQQVALAGGGMWLLRAELMGVF
ncbi:MAG TPA: hypothetical protein VFZ61_30520 [Polyangiales bacterium]